MHERVTIIRDKRELGREAVRMGASLIREAISKTGQSTIILATGASQFEMLEALVHEDVDWSHVEVFHLDEYIGLPVSHPASFRNYLLNRFVTKVVNLRVFHAIGGDAGDLAAEIDRISSLITERKVDVAFVGVGENGHVAFNDPPADFETEAPYLIVELDEACRKQQMGEGWFDSLEEVPPRAVTMSVRQIMKSRHVIVTSPDARKASAVRSALEGPLSNQCPASILRTHPDCHWYLDGDSSSLLGETC